tara:strand:- start:2959 stop:3651 length:693 start_codon:yes stop_codon:yes gene_type:complete
MKKFLLTFCLLFTTNFCFSQSLVVAGDSIIYGNAIDFQLESHLQVINVSNDSVWVYCEKNVILQNPPGLNNFCWGGTCYGENTIVSTKVDSIAPGAKCEGFTGYYQPWSVPDTAIVEYCFYLASNLNDRTCFQVTYIALDVTDIENIINSEKIGSFYPNPTNEYANIFYSVKDVSELKITDVLGNVVKNIELEGSGEKTLYVGDLPKGIYLANLMKNQEIVKTRKLIINK